MNNVDYISLIYLARYKKPDSAGDSVIKWMSKKRRFMTLNFTLIIENKIKK